MSPNELPPSQPTGLARYRLLSPRAGVHVSPIQLGAMSIGDKWGDLGMGTMDKESSFKLLDAYFDNGGNFIDTANSYQDGSSEAFIGEWAENRGVRDRLFLATKYTLNNTHPRDGSIPAHKILYVGNSAKSLHLSVKQSLKSLRTDYIDLLYLHWWDWDTSIEEIMGALHNLVVQGKVLYLGISDTPAWVVSKANQYAREHGMTPFVIYQGMWNILERSFEREIIPMARAEGMALAPWNVLAQGKIRTDEEEENRAASGENGRTMFSDEWRRNEQEVKVSHALEKVASEVGAKNITSVAIAYLMQKTTFVFPIVGGRKVEHLLANLEALVISLSDEQIKFLESVVPFDIGFPCNIIGTGVDSSVIVQSGGLVDKQPMMQPIRPVKG
ncbi:arylalcohol dehydrogenase [Crassisporium funariophilum]|nr:arylalcohol dehydrogenase [Crassisporium funariophilum]